MATNTNGYTHKLLEKFGYCSATVEHYNHRTGRSLDFLGFLDVLAWRPLAITEVYRSGELLEGREYPPWGVLGIQTTTDGHLQERVRKILEDEKLLAKAVAWLQAGNRIECWGWAGRKLLGDKRVRYVPNVVRLRLEANKRGVLQETIEKKAVSELTLWGWEQPVKVAGKWRVGMGE